jgi:hypothetical protein
MKRLSQQIFHLDKARPRDASEKFQLEDAKAVVQWIEEGIREFRKGLKPEDQAKWNETIAPADYSGLTIRLEQAKQTACTAGPLTSSTFIQKT